MENRHITQNLVEFAQSEFAAAAMKRNPEAIDSGTASWINNIESSVLDILRIMDKLDSGDRSRWLAMSLLNRLANGQVITPLTGDESEWFSESQDGVRQNKRCPHVFMRQDGTCFDSRAIIKVSSDGKQVESVESRDIQFPYMPKQEVVKAESLVEVV